MKKQQEHRINYLIREKQVRLVGDNVTNDVVDIKLAMSIAKNLDLDLVEITSPSRNNPSICKIIDYNKFLYEKKKKDKDNKKKQKLNQTSLKEIRLTPNTDNHDFNFKLENAKKFLKSNDKVLFSVFFKGREIVYKEKGEIMLLKIAKELEDIGIPEYLPKLEKRKMTITIKPKK